MARPRFQRLPAAQQTAILDAALDEFARLGFAGASLNRIISAAEISKGAMYYYFDGKEDLYAEIIRRQLEGLFQHGVPVPLPDASGPDEFWSSIEALYLRLMQLLGEKPETGNLLRDWLTGAASPALRAAQRDAEQQTLPWVLQTVLAGQRLGAVRADMPAEFLVAMAMGMGQAMDTWLVVQNPAGSELEDAVHALIDMMRRALQP